MGLLDFMKKKKEELPLPPPPIRPMPRNDMSIDELPGPPNFEGDIESIRPGGRLPELPELPEVPDFSNHEFEDAEIPELPRLPELPEMPEENKIIEDLPEMPELPEWNEPSKIEDQKNIDLPRKRIVPSKAFVAVDEYRKIFDESNIIRAKIMEAETLLKQLSEIKESEEKLFEKWHAEVENIEKKLSYVDQIIGNAQR